MSVFLFQIAVIGLSSEVTYPREDACVKSTLVPMTFESKFFFTRFIDNLEKQDSKFSFSDQTLPARPLDKNA